MAELGPETLVEMASIADDLGHDVSWGHRMRQCAAAWEADRERARIIEDGMVGASAHIAKLEERIRVLERDNARLGAALYDALEQFDDGSDPRWEDIERDHSLGQVRIRRDDARAPEEGV